MEPSLVTKDELTGLYNRCYANKALKQNISLAKQQGLSVAVILIDIDHFKNINDRFGHAAGDLVLQKVAELLKTTFRNSDLVCRCGGDEFLVILPNTNIDSAYKRAEELRLAIKSLEISSHITLTASFGVAGFPEQGETATSLLDSAKQALDKPIYTDELTGLYNHRYANKALQENLSLAKQEGLSLAIILIDLNLLGNFGNHLSDYTGNIVLQKVGELLKTTFRDSGIVCRYKVLEFLVILPNTSWESAYYLAEELHVAIQSLEISISYQDLITLTPSFGVACFPRQGETVENLLKEAYRALDKPIYTDELTGLYNRRYLDKALEENLSLAKQKELSVAIILLNIDHLKKINDNFGINAADLVLQKIAELLKTTFKDDEIVCRYGGNEFLVILLNTSLDSAYERAEELRLVIKSLEINYKYSEQPITLTASFGVACSEPGETAQTLLKAADQGLYEAKKAGCDRVCLAENSFKDELTNLYNTRYANKALEENLNLTTEEGLSVAIILLDIDNFRNINYQFGSLTGNFVLQKVAEFLKTTLRDNEIVCRYRVDEFLVILPLSANIISNYERAEELRRAIKSLEIKYNEQIITLTASFAVVCEQAETATSILDAAYLTLYKAKSNGGDRVYLFKLFETDELTGIYNRRYADKALEETLSLGKQKGLSGAIILLDLDYFRNINDRFGHLIGDLVLQKIGELLKTTFRDSGIPCRYSGYEFLIILLNTSVDSACAGAEELRLAIKSLRISSEQGIITLTASFGIACFPEHGETANQIIQKADVALYIAHSKGYDQVCLPS